MYRTYIFLKKNIKGISALWCSYTSATVLGNLNNTVDDFINAMSDYTNIANIVFYIFTIVLVCLIVLYRLSYKIVKITDPTDNFIKIMNDKTYDLFRSDATGQIDFSWGYNKNIHRSKNPSGWDPSNFWLVYDNNNTYKFPTKESDDLKRYTDKDYKKFLKSEEMQECKKNRNDMDRFAAYEIIPNFNDKDKRIQINIKKTKWSALQFHWSYFRLLSTNNVTIERSDAVKKAYQKVFLNQADNEYMLNSFCLHLILEDSNGNAILSRISSNKANDYSSTWAATIGEQLSLEDFYNVTDNSTYPDFVIRWTKRALEEEFDISEQDSGDIEDELNEYVDMDSLKVLSIDMEGDIYNIALTAVIKLRITVDELRNKKGITIDSEELTELSECSLDNIRQILLGYPENSNEYHPSTYLRLLMFYLYKKGIKKTCKDFYDEKSKVVRKKKK